MVLGSIVGWAGVLTATSCLIVGIVAFAYREMVARETTLAAGFATFGVGSMVAALGLLVYLNSTTGIDQQLGGAAATSKPITLDAFLRQPTWNGVPTSSETATAAAPPTFPLAFTASF